MLDRQYVYFPTPWQERDWRAVSSLPLEEVWFRAPDGTRLFGWYVPAPSAVATFLWCHGNAGNIIDRLENLMLLHGHGLSVFIFDYRGYGRSRGEPTEEGLYQDALAAYDVLTGEKRVDPAGLLLFGRSLGAAVTGELARRRPAAGVILEGAFPSVEAVARKAFFGLPAHLLLKARFDLARRLKEVRVPVLVLHANRDSVIPLEMGRAVYEAANEPKEFYRIPGADHNDAHLAGGEAYFQRLLKFTRAVIS